MPPTKGPKAPGTPLTAEQVAGLVLFHAQLHGWYGLRLTNADASNAGEKPIWLFLKAGHRPLLTWCKTDEGVERGDDRGLSSTQAPVAAVGEAGGCEVWVVSPDRFAAFDERLQEGAG